MITKGTVDPSGIELPPNFHYGPVDPEPGDTPEVPKPDPPLGVLVNFAGTFAGTGFNTIFRPDNTVTPTKFPTPVNPPSAAVLELNLTTEEISFSKPLGDVPNRGFKTQGDIHLNGVPYLQTVQDVTNQTTGKADNPPEGIHTETGFWMHVPSTNVNPVLGNTLVRTASIPHGTTINSQSVPPEPTRTSAAPDIGPRPITPFADINNQRIEKPQPSQTADNPTTARIPQDLGPFIKEGTITAKILENPAQILNDINAQLKITATETFTVSTDTSTQSGGEPGGGTANIAFLVGSSASTAGPSPNANVPSMTSTFWIETVSTTITIPSYQPAPSGFCPTPLLIQPNFVPTAGKTVPPLPTFEVVPPKEITQPLTVEVEYVQIQYAQVVLLSFNGLSWPHVSVATLVPKYPIVPKIHWT